MSTSSFWDERFASETYVYGEAPNAFLKSQVHTLPAGGQVLSLGEGEGRNGVFLATQGFSVTALDSSEQGFAKTRELASRNKVSVSTRFGDVTHADLGKEEWDAIINIYCHLPSPERQALYPRITAALRPGGVFLSEQFSKEQLAYQSGGPKVEDMLLSLDELSAAFEGWEILVAKKEVVLLDEGPFHQGEGSVLRFVARKPS